MKKFYPITLLVLLLFSCTTKFDLYCYDGDTTIVYSVLEVKADTNYFRISKSSLEHEYDYNYDDIDVRFAGLFRGESQPDTIMLDTITLMTDGFPKTYYFTTKKLIENQEYSIIIHRKADDVTISSKARTICEISIIRPLGKYINLQSDLVNQVQWIGRHHDNAPNINAGFFDMNAYFHYKELMPGATDTVDRYMLWPIASGQAEEWQNTTYNFYAMHYTPSVFFTQLGNDEYLNNNTPIGVQRWLEPFEFRLSVYGDELYEYYVANNSTSIIPEVPNYSNIDNGIGLLSSRATIKAFFVIDQLSRKKISNDYPFGFVYDPNL